jgi:hypothetical protein
MRKDSSRMARDESDLAGILQRRSYRDLHYDGKDPEKTRRVTSAQARRGKTLWPYRQGRRTLALRWAGSNSEVLAVFATLATHFLAGDSCLI